MRKLKGKERYEFFGAASLFSELSLTILIKELAVVFFLHF